MAIYDCFTYVEDESSITIRKYTGGGGIVNIPNEIKGKPVTDVSYCAFEDCRNIEFLTIPNNVKTMYQAFDNVIGGSFACGIERIYIGSGCEHLSNLCLVHELQSIEVAPDNQHYSAVNGVLFNKSQTVLERYPPAKADDAFTIPDDVVRIAGRAFQGCRYLKSVTLGKHIKEIDKYTFFECWALTEIIYTGETKMFPDAYSPKEWSELVLKYRLDGFDGSDLKVYSRNSYSYELIWDDVDINKLAIQKDWFKMILEDKDEFDKLCREYALMFVWYED